MSFWTARRFFTPDIRDQRHLGRRIVVFSMTDRIILVTGAGSGIGKVTALRLGELESVVIVVDQNGDTARETVQDLTQSNRRAVAMEADVSNPDDVARVFSDVEAQYQRLDGIIHCAGIGAEKTILETTLEDWERLIRVNLTGTFLCAQAAAKIMVKQRYGRIVLMGSAAGERGGTGRTAYGASKGGVSAMTRVLSVELAELGITVNALAPGAIETELVAKMHDAETRTSYCSRIPANRYGSPDEVAAAAVFLVSEESRYISGVVLPIDGGFLAGGVIKRQSNPF
tara:strand:- start:2459 stop:3313 length:855 start_codon:yes stop_codon:yes gene_type:complete